MKAGRDATQDFGYHLPEDRIARYPAARRDQSRLLVAPRSGEPFEHRVFRHLPGLMRAGDVLVVNESRVLPVRLLGAKPTGARAEVLLLRPLGKEHPSEAAGTDGAAREGRARRADGRLWEALVRPGGKLKPGRTVEVAPDLVVHILDSTPDHGRIVRVETPLTVDAALERHGRVPLPPYLRRPDEPVDRARYQTVYARTPGSVAAPTAGLHFTRELMDALEAGGVRIVRVTLHVGVATFRPAGPPGGDPRGPGEERYSIPRRGRPAGRGGARRRGAGVGGGHHGGADAGERGRRDGRGAGRVRHDRSLHPPALRLPGRRRPDHQLPSAALDPAHAGGRLRRP